MRRCLLLGCSQAKIGTPGEIPALERYDGPAFRVLRKFLAECPQRAQDVTLFVLSAEFGLISGSRPIPAYDRQMTRERARELHSQVLDAFREQIAHSACQDLFISAGKTYLLALSGYGALLPAGVNVTAATAASGQKLAMLKSWLYGGVLQPGGRERESFQPALPGEDNQPVQIRGRRIAMNYDEIMNTARQALAASNGEAHNFRTWYTLVDEQEVSTKWLVSQLSGLAVGAFTADEARRVLRGLSVPFYRRG